VVPARHPPVQDRRLIEDYDQDRSQSDGGYTARPAPFYREEEKCRGDGNQGAGDGEGEVLDAVPKTERRQQTSGEAPRAFDPVGAGERPAPFRMETGGLPEQQAREQTGGQQGDHQRRHLPGKGEVGAGDAAEEETARPEEDDAERQEEREAQKQNGRPAGGGAPAADERPRSGKQHPDSQGDEIDQLDSVKGDVQLPQQNDLPEERDEACQEQRCDVGDHRSCLDVLCAIIKCPVPNLIQIQEKMVACTTRFVACSIDS